MSEPNEIKTSNTRNVGSRGRFEKGNSGNPRGRPRKSSQRPKTESILRRNVQVTFEGETIAVKPAIAVLLALLMKGIGGDSAAAKEFLKQYEKFHAAGAGQPDIKKIVRTIVRSQTHIALHDLELFIDVNGNCGLELWVIKESIKRNPTLSVAGLDRNAILALFEVRRAAEKLLLPHGLALAPPEEARTEA